MKQKRQPILILLILCLISFLPIGQARAAESSPGAQAVMLYQSRKYQEALPLFKQAVKERPQDANSLYYYGLTLHQLGQVAAAKEIYNKLIGTFPGSPAAKQAMGIMFPSGGATRAPATAPTTGRATVVQTTPMAIGTSTDLSGLPQEARVYFKKEGNALVVDAELNNRPIAMIFDTGAEVCAFGKNHLRELGIPLPQGSPTGMASGVGDGGLIPTWTMNADLKLGSIYRKNMRIMVQENLPGEPLLGQTFFKDFRYTIDNGANSIHFVIKQAPRSLPVASRGYSPSASTADRYAVPFSREGNEMIVSAEVNGRPIKMIFDTGASATVFTNESMQQLGINIPEDAEVERHIGIAGETAAVGFPVSRMRLGPIEKSNFNISVTQGMRGHPLLGQTFYGDWQYSIDNAAGLIRFVRR
jgi:clan AA aspartic protease (TIGR02281 family)